MASLLKLEQAKRMLELQKRSMERDRSEMRLHQAEMVAKYHPDHPVCRWLQQRKSAEGVVTEPSPVE
ncbi:MAG: hypothetical protein ACRC46_13995 [Thermoguttaceae bacterium]